MSHEKTGHDWVRFARYVMRTDMLVDYQALLNLAWTVQEVGGGTRYRFIDEWGYCVACPEGRYDERDRHDDDCMVSQAKRILAPLLFP
jgi:hypothetical protein